MSAYARTFVSTIVLTILSVTASAAVNNVDSHGRFVPMGSKSATTSRAYNRSYGRSYTRSYRSVPAFQRPTYVQAPAAGCNVTMPAPVVAATVTPAPVIASAPASAAPVVASAPEAGRRFSYNPAPANCVPAAGSAVRAPSVQRYAGPRRGSATIEQWQVPKADPRKYSNR